MPYKKWILIVLSVLLLLVVSACNSEEADEQTTSPVTVREDDMKNYYDELGIDISLRDTIVSGNLPYKTYLGGYVGERVKNNEKKWLCTALKNNPYILDAIKLRNDSNKYDIVTWYGEFPGALLYGVASCYKLTRDEEVYKAAEDLVEKLAELQAENGYLGNYSDSEQLNPKYWDVGAHFFLLHGLIEWYEASGSEAALETAEKIGSLLHRYRCIRQQEISVGQLMVISPLARLYKITGDKDLLQLINNLSKYANESCNFYQGGLDRIDFYKLPIHRWENLFDIQAYGDLADIYQDDSYVTSMINHWNSLLKTDRHTTGGMTTGETTVGTPFTNGPIETCASILWEDLTATCYGETLDSYMIDEIELTFYNAILGAQLPDGSMWTYDTPREGRKIPSNEELSWQATPRSPDFNCCSANSARGIGLLHKWTTYTDENGLRINYYGEGSIITSTPDGNVIYLTQQTVYPENGSIKITLDPEKRETFSLMLRIPFWADGSKIRINGGEYENVTAGEYYAVTREWSRGDIIELELSMNLHYMNGKEAYSDYSVMYYGPVLLAMDEANNAGWNKVKPDFNIDTIDFTLVAKSDNMVTAKVKTAGGVTITLCDFASCGSDKCFYTTWFRISGLGEAPDNIDWNVR